MRYFGKIGYVANSTNTVITGCMSSGRVFDKINDEYFAKIRFITGNVAIAKVLDSDEFTAEIENPESDVHYLSQNTEKSAFLKMMKMMTLGNNINLNPKIELLTPQIHENMAIIPLKSERTYIDIITLKKGLELELVEVKECEVSQVNTLIVKNNAVTPLILVDGDEVVGGDQNRIVNATILIGANSEMAIPVSCTEKGR